MPPVERDLPGIAVDPVLDAVVAAAGGRRGGPAAIRDVHPGPGHRRRYVLTCQATPVSESVTVDYDA